MDMTVQPNVTHSIPVRVARGLSLPEARDLLDWLEAHAINEPSFDVDSAGRCDIIWVDDEHPAGRAASAAG